MASLLLSSRSSSSILFRWVNAQSSLASSPLSTIARSFVHDERARERSSSPPSLSKRGSNTMQAAGAHLASSSAVRTVQVTDRKYRAGVDPSPNGARGRACRATQKVDRPVLTHDPSSSSSSSRLLRSQHTQFSPPRRGAGMMAMASAATKQSRLANVEMAPP